MEAVISMDMVDWKNRNAVLICKSDIDFAYRRIIKTKINLYRVVEFREPGFDYIFETRLVLIPLIK